jgi:outer membrane protein with beta-barrel domain
MRRLSSLTLLLLALATPVAAQDARGDVAIGAGILHDSDLEETFPAGWVFAVTGNIGPMLGIVGEMGGSYKSVDVLGTDVNFRVHSFLGGLRFMNRTQRAVPFAQFLVGAANGQVSMLGQSESSTGLAFQPGGGADILLSERFGIRFQGDYRIIRDDGETTNEFRFAAGAVFAF